MLHWFTCKKKNNKIVFKSEKVYLESLEKKTSTAKIVLKVKANKCSQQKRATVSFFTLVANRKEQSVSCRDSSLGEIFTNIKL